MKFKTNLDEIQYNLLNLNEKKIRKKLKLIPRSKDHKKSKEMTKRWRRDKHKMEKGIKKWHKSTDGKRFHRALGRFNSLRENTSSLTIKQVNDALLSLSSIETHLYLELQYYESDSEAMIQFLDIIDDYINDSSYLKNELIKAFETGHIEEEDYILLTDIIQFFQDPKMYLYIKREINGLNNDITINNDNLSEQLEYISSINILEDSRNIYENIDKLFEIK